MKLRMFLFIFLVAGACPTLSQRQPDALPAVSDEESGEVLGYKDEGLRMTVAVTLGGRGPYRFLVDTGSERTVIAAELAEQLGLAAGRRAQIHSLTEVSDAPTVIIPSIEIGGRSVQNIHAPAFLERNIGAQGVLGVDMLQAQNVSFDFSRRKMVVGPARRDEMRWESDTIVVTARRRFGHLVLVDAAAEGQKVWVIIDTGAEISLANNALRSKLERRGRLGPTRPVAMVSITGAQTIVDQTIARRIRLGTITVTDMPIAFADVEIFRVLDLADRPAILLGMDVLKMFERVSVDFANKKVRLQPPPNAGI